MISPLAYIRPDAKLGSDVTVEPFAVIHEDTIIGDGTWIASHAVISPGARIGKNCKIYPGACISSAPQDLKYAGEVTTAEIGDNTVVREYVTISKGTSDRFTTKVGANCLLMAYVHVAHDAIVGDNCILANTVQIAGHVVLGDWVIIGGTSAVHQFVKIGSHAMISGGSIVLKDVPPFTKAGREPLAYCGINSVGLRRRGFTNEKINEIQEIFRTLYLKGNNNSKALQIIEMEMPPSPERDEVINFVRGSERGIMRGISD